MDKAALLALADRVEALDGPCRETEDAIAVALDIWWVPNHCRGGPYTASLDAAMTLATSGADPLDLLETAITSARDARDGIYFLPLHICLAALRALANGEGHG